MAQIPHKYSMHICPGTCSPGKPGGNRLPVMMPALAITGCPMPVIAGSALPRQKTDCVFFAGIHYIFCRKTTRLPVLPHNWHTGNSNGAARHILHCTLPATLQQTTPPPPPPPKFVVIACHIPQHRTFGKVTHQSEYQLRGQCKTQHAQNAGLVDT